MKNNKLIITFCILLIFTTLFPIIYAHSGRTDSSGGHYNRSTGEYHYHHGYSAHQHPNGVCPYNTNVEVSSPTKTYDSKTNRNETANSSSNSLVERIENIRKNQENETTDDKNEFDWCGMLCFILSGSSIGFAFYQAKRESSTYIYCKYCNTKNNSNRTSCTMCGKELKK